MKELLIDIATMVFCFTIFGCIAYMKGYVKGYDEAKDEYSTYYKKLIEYEYKIYESNLFPTKEELLK